MDSSTELKSEISFLVEKDYLSIYQYPHLIRWLRICGVLFSQEHSFKYNPLSKFVPTLLPILFIIASIFQDLFCYSKVSGCSQYAPMYGESNVTYNSKTIYIWIGTIVGIISLHVNVVLYARSGKFEFLFSLISRTSPTDANNITKSRTNNNNTTINSNSDSKNSNYIKVRNYLIVFGVAWVVLICAALGASFAYAGYRVGDDCPQRYMLLCTVPQTIQIVAGFSVLMTGVGLTLTQCLLLKLFILQQQDKHEQLLKRGEFKSYIIDLQNIKKIIKEMCNDTQLGNALALGGGIMCTFASLWTFAEEYAARDSSVPIAFSISIWTLIVSLALTFLTLFAFARVTKACDNLIEETKQHVTTYVLDKAQQPNVSLTESFVIISTWQQRFGFHVGGILMQPEIVRALASAGITMAVTIIKLVLPS